MKKQYQILVIDEVGVKKMFIGNKLNDALDIIEHDVNSIICDTTTAKGRAAITTLATKVVKSRQIIENEGKSIVESAKAKVKVIDILRKSSRDRLNALRDKIKAPLLAWRIEDELRAEKIKNDELIFNCWATAHFENARFNARVKNEAEILAKQIEEKRLADIELQKMHDKKVAANAVLAAKQKIIDDAARVINDNRAFEENRIESEKNTAIQKALNEQNKKAKADIIKKRKKESANVEQIHSESFNDNIFSEIYIDLVNAGLSDKLSINLIELMSKNKIRHVHCDYLSK